MKTYYYIFILIILFGCGCLNKQPSNSSEQETNAAHETNQDYKALSTFNGDSLKYVKENFLEKKEFYLHKELNVLLNDLEIPPKTFLLGSDPRYMDLSPDISLQFYTNKEIDGKIKQRVDPIIINIYWKESLPMDSISALLRKNHGNWADDERKYFGKQIVKDITIVNYNFK